MTDFRKVTDDFSVSPQIDPQDMAAAAAQGFTRVINNRPDDEVPGQPTNAVMEAAAKAAGLTYVHIPVVGRPNAEQAEATRKAAEGARTLAFCRSGTRSITAWAMGEAAAGARPRDDLVRLAADAGYDLAPILG